MARRVYTEASASLRLFGERLDPLAVTWALRIPPDAVHRNGEPRLRRDGKGHIVELPPWRTGFWSFSSEQWVQSPQLVRHVVWLLEQIEPRAAMLAALLREGATADIFAFSRGRTDRPPDLPRAVRARAAALGLPIGIDHYATPPESAP